MKMRARHAVLGVGIASAFLSGILLAATSPTRALAELSAVDREAMERARSDVLEKMKPGEVSTWKDERTGHSGEARLLRTYEQNGMSCGEVEHVLRIRQVSRFVMPFCRTGEGAWRLAF